MESAISPQYFATNILAKLFNNNLEPTANNIKYVWNLASSLNYGLPNLTDDQIDIWISLLSFLRSFFFKNNDNLKLYILPSIIEVAFISTQIEQICAKKGKIIPDLLKILEGTSEDIIQIPEKIIEFPIVPTIQSNGIVTDIIESFNMFKPLHQFEMPTYDSIIHYSIIMSLLYCKQLHQPSLTSFEAFKKRTKYIFNFPEDFVCDVCAMPPIDEPFSFILIRSIFEDLNDIHLKRPFRDDRAFSNIRKQIIESKEKIDQTKFFSTFVYIESKPISFPLDLCSTEYSSLIFLLICEYEFNSEIKYEKEEKFHLTPNFLMANKFSNFFSRNIEFEPLIDSQMKYFFNLAKYVIEKVEPTPIEILSDKDGRFTLQERLHALGSLYVEELREDVYSSVLSFWCFCASNLISELEKVPKITSEYLNGLIGICRVATTFSKKEEYRPIDSILNTHSEKFEGEVPSEFPFYSYSTPSEVLSKCDSFNINYGPLKNVVRYLLLITSLDFQIKPNEKMNGLNSDYFCSSKDEKQSLEDPFLFIALRYIYENTFNTTIKRQSENDNVFTEASQIETTNDALNLLVFNKGTKKIYLTKEIFEKREIYFALMTSNAFVDMDPLSLCDSLCHNGLQIAAFVINSCQSEVENLVMRASFDDFKAANQLLQHKECLPLLTKKDSICHSLLKIFLSDEDPTFSSEIDEEEWTELSAKLLVCKERGKTVPTDFLIQIIKKCYSLLFDDPILSVLDKDIYLYLCGVMEEQNIFVYEKVEQFFTKTTNDDEECSLNYTNTILYCALHYLKDQEHPELIHYYSDFANHSLVSQKIKEILPEPEEYRSIYWFLCTCILPYNRASDFSFLLEETKPKFIRPLYQYLLLEKDVTCLVQMLQNNHCSNAVEKIGLEYLQQSLELFFVTDSNEAISVLSNILFDEDREFLIDFISTHIFEYPTQSLKVFKKFKIDEKSAIEFISHLPKLNDQIIPKISLSFFESILQPISKSYLHILHSKSHQLEINWKEDGVIKGDYIDLWKEVEYTNCEGNNENSQHAAFYCYTCGIQDSYICTACAATCHKGHRVSFIKKCKFNCSCKNHNKCVLCSGREETKKEEKQIHPPTSKLVDLLIAFSKIEDERTNQNASPTQIVSRISRPIASFLNRSYDLLLVAPRVSFKEKKSNFIDLSNTSRFYSHDNQLFKKRCSYVPLKLAEYIDGRIIIAAGKTLYSIDEDSYEVTKTVQLNEELLSVKLAESTNDLLVLTSLKSVTILATSDFEEIFRISLNNLSEENSIMQAEMMTLTQVTVVTRYFVQVYEIGVTDPIEVFNVNNDSITSAVFLNYRDKPYGIFALNNGKIALQVLGEGETSRSFTRFSKIPSRFVSISISYSPECNMFFIAAPGTSIQFTRIENVFKSETTQTQQLRSGLVNEMSFVSTYPGVDSLLLFSYAGSNSLYAVEFAEEGSEISAVESSHRKSDFSLFGNRISFYAFVKTKSDILAISTTGSLLKMVGKEDNEYRAPPSLFAACEIANEENAEITGTDGSQDYNTLFRDSVAFFHIHVETKIMTLVLKDESYSIVGFNLSFSRQSSNHRPSYISVFDRKYNCLGGYTVMVSLKPDEVKPGKPLEIYFSNTATSDIAMQGIRIFIIKSDLIKPFLTEKIASKSGYNSLNDGLLDFEDQFNQTETGAVANLVSMAAMSIAFDEVDQIETVSFKKLVCLAYENMKLSRFAKSAVVRIVRATSDEQRRRELLRLWGEELARLMEAKLVHESMWGSAWHDYMMMPEEVKAAIAVGVWESKPRVGSAESILSAFTFKG